MPITKGTRQPQSCICSLHHAQRLAAELPAGIEAALVRRRVLHQQRRGRAHLAAGGKALDQARQHHQHRPHHPHLGVGGRHRDQPAAQPHQPQGQRHGGAAAVAVGVGTNQPAAHRPHQEAHAEGGGGQQQLAITGRGRKEQRPDDEHQEREHGEIEELQRVADGGAGDHAPAHRR
ncbi:hypothetical protein G6F57_020414 [Rhizopus arrhizus]|nr:hypothetical protein G6F57_020414 [Rhizopus arrhizus]